MILEVLKMMMMMDIFLVLVLVFEWRKCNGKYGYWALNGVAILYVVSVGLLGSLYTKGGSFCGGSLVSAELVQLANPYLRRAVSL